MTQSTTLSCEGKPRYATLREAHDSGIRPIHLCKLCHGYHPGVDETMSAEARARFEAFKQDHHA